MKTTADFLDDLRAHFGLPSDNKLAARMGWERQQVSRYRQKKHAFDDRTAVKVSTALGIEPDYVLACMAAQRAVPESRSAWERIAAKIAAGVLIAVGLSGILQNQTVRAESLSSSGPEYTYAPIRRRRGLAWRERAAQALSAGRRVLGATLTALAFLAIPAHSAEPGETDTPPYWKQQDKREHLAGSLAFTFVAGLTLHQTAHPVLYGAAAGLALGVTKELLDRRQKGNYFSAADLVADSIGVALGAGAASVILSRHAVALRYEF